MGGVPFALSERKDRSKSPPSSPYDGGSGGGGGDGPVSKEVTTEELASSLEMYKERIDNEVTGKARLPSRRRVRENADLSMNPHFQRLPLSLTLTHHTYCPTQVASG